MKERSGYSKRAIAVLEESRELADKYHDSALKFCAMNTTKARRLAIKEGIMGLPVMAIYKDGKQVESLVKEDCTRESITALVEKYVK